MISRTPAPHRLAVPLVAALLVIAGCATMPPPTSAQVALATAAVNQAQSAGAAQYAPLELRAAQDKLTRANAMANSDLVIASRLAEAAEADARLAEARTQHAKADHAANALQSSLRTLKQELERPSAGTGTGDSR